MKILITNKYGSTAVFAAAEVEVLEENIVRIRLNPEKVEYYADDLQSDPSDDLPF